MGLFEKRARNIRFVLENVMDQSCNLPSTGDTMIRAVRAYSCLDADGRWVDPPRHLIITRNPSPPAPALPVGKEITVEPEMVEKGT